ncbi:MAG: cysteine desulfurase family protein [Candidatus Izemoplasmatales bacterium]|nr:cysteine desulfurase family protein [Candidatus Izemoplasmatales bacterium]
MVYLDYSATTPVGKQVLDQYILDNELFYGNPNSTHKLGLVSKNAIDKASKDILDVFDLDGYEVVYTSGASESNNLAIKGIAYAKQNTGNHIITSNFEHSSVVACFTFLSKQGFSVDVAPYDEYGLVDLEKLEKKITNKTTLVSISAVNSETGIVQDLKAISLMLKKYPHVTFHSDLTQAVGKIKLDYSLVDLFSFSGHKIYGLKGIGGLLIRKGIKVIPQIHGGKSTTRVRSGTPASPLMLSLRNALVLMYQDFDKKIEIVQENYNYFIEKLKEVDNAVLNSNQYSLKQIVNVSFLDVVNSFLHQELSNRDVFVSTSTACGSENPMSVIVKKLTGSLERAETSIRISLSHLTTKKEIDQFFESYQEIIRL